MIFRRFGVDGLLIEQVIINILENAIKYTNDDSKVIISARLHNQQHMRIVIEDNGPGIAESQQEKVFDKFITASQGDQRKGTGLGLAICKGIIQAHSGKIIARRSSIGGAAFIITLPIGKVPPEQMLES